MSPTESLRPKPVTIKAVHPEIPITVIKKCFLYRVRFRAVALWVNFMRDDIKGIRSRNIRFPAFGERGSIKLEGFSFSTWEHAHIVATIVLAIADTEATKANPQLNCVIKFGR